MQRGFDALAGQQRAFDLHEMHVMRIVDAGVAHRQMHRLHRLLDLRVATDLFRQEFAGVGDADGERLSLVLLCAAAENILRANTVRCGDSTPSVPPDMTKAISSSTARGVSPRCGDSARKTPPWRILG